MVQFKETNIAIKNTRYSIPSHWSITTLCCQQVFNKEHFNGDVRNITYNRYYKRNFKSKFLKYLMERTFSDLQYNEKAETQFNIRLNNHRKRRTQQVQLQWTTRGTRYKGKDALTKTYYLIISSQKTSQLIQSFLRYSIFY